MRPHGTPDALSEFTRGASDVGRGLSFLLRRPRLWPWAAVPFVLIGLLFAGLAWYCWHLSERWFQATLGASETWWSDPLAWVLGLLFWILVVFVLVFAFVPLATLVAAPFNDILSEKVEGILGCELNDPSFSFGRLVREGFVSLSTCFRLLTVTFVLHLAVLPLYLVPVIGLPAGTAAAIAIDVRFVVLEFTSYSMERRAYTYRQQRDFLRRYRARTWGFGSMAFVLMAIPGLNALFIPVSVVAVSLKKKEREFGAVEGAQSAAASR